MPTTWDEHGNVITAPPAASSPKQWDEKGNPISAAPQNIVTPKEGESFADTMKRGIEFGKKVTPEQLAASQHDALRKVPTVLGASILAGPALVGGTLIGPEAASAAAGGGVLGATVGGATGGAGMEILNKALRGAAGQSVLNLQSAKDIGISAAVGGAAGVVLGLFEKVAASLLTSKIARGAINESVGATTRDVTYGNPAVGILKANVTSPFTGDLEAYKAALREGLPPEQALVRAGGRVAQVAQNVNTLSPQLDTLLSQSTAQLKVADIIDKPLNDAISDIAGNRAMTEAEKDAAVTQIGALQKSLKEGLGDTITPLQANQIKQAIGNRINWAGNIAVTDEVKPAYRAVYSTLKNAVNKAVPGSSAINEDLTNLLAAQTDLQKLMQAEEVGAGKGALGSAVTGIARRFEAVAGRFIPGLAGATTTAQSATPVAAAPVGASIAEILKAKGITLPGQQQTNPSLPFHPGAGITR